MVEDSSKDSNIYVAFKDKGWMKFEPYLNSLYVFDIRKMKILQDLNNRPTFTDYSFYKLLQVTNESTLKKKYNELMK